MAQRIVEIPGIGQVVLAKRKGSRHLRLSVAPNGRVRIGLPVWTPYVVGISFAKSRQEWIIEQLKAHQTFVMKNGDRIGKAHRIYFYQAVSSVPGAKTRVTKTTVEIKTSLGFDSDEVQKKARAACERALKSESELLLPKRLAVLAQRHKYTYKSVRIKKLTSRWGSCSHQKVISLSYYLIQLPWPLIDYVLMHELTHTRHLNHGTEFWVALEKALPNARVLKKTIRSYKSSVVPNSGHLIVS